MSADSLTDLLLVPAELRTALVQVNSGSEAELLSCDRLVRPGAKTCLPTTIMRRAEAYFSDYALLAEPDAAAEEWVASSSPLRRAALSLYAVDAGHNPPSNEKLVWEDDVLPILKLVFPDGGQLGTGSPPESIATSSGTDPPRSLLRPRLSMRSRRLKRSRFRR